ncbi:MAG: autotransporter domain-containing protein [Treponema sp.]|nr:autotransporter domain-containing protein [Treponema sp.]
MGKKGLILLVLAVFVTSGIFAQKDYKTMAKNTITVDAGPALVGLAIGQIGRYIDEDGPSTSGFGIGAQYERQIHSNLSVAGRFAYLRGDLGIVEDYYDTVLSANAKASLGINITSFSIEGHVRYYPGSETFFLDGMLGYANLSTSFSGDVVVEAGGLREKESASVTASRNYFKFGAKLGWRISFGKNGGFTFEPAIGYYGAIGMGDTIQKQLAKGIGKDEDTISGFDDAFKIVENFIFVGGPRVTLSFGYRF